MTGTVVTHKTQVGQSNTAANNFTIRTLDDGSLRVSRGNAGAETSDVLVIDANGNFSTAPVLGVGQTWQDVTASRVSGTTYTNTTGQPIMVHVGFSNGNVTAVVGGVTIATTSYAAAFVVPSGTTYTVTLASTTNVKWAELR